MMKLGAVIPHLKKIQKCIIHMTHYLNFADTGIFSPEIGKFCYIGIYKQELHFDTCFLIILSFSEPLWAFLINIIAFFTMPAKLVTPGVLKIKTWRKIENMTSYFLSIKSLTKFFR